MLEPYVRDLRDRTEAVFRSLPPARGMGAPSSRSVVLGAKPPTWMLLPALLHRTWRATQRPDDPKLLDVLWGQYALFLYVRIQDDLLDRHVDDLRLQFLADRFLVESLAALERVPELGRGFWRSYREYLGETVDGILRVHELEAVPGAFTSDHLRLHGSVGAIFKIGTTAVCHIHERAPDCRWLGKLQDQLCVVGQVCDDLVDVADDLATGRFTFVGNALIGAREGEEIAPEEAARRLSLGLLKPVCSEGIWTELRRAADVAGAAVEPSAPDSIAAIVDALRAREITFRNRVHETGVHLIFGDLVTHPN
jgi:hypothetical protein